MNQEVKLAYYRKNDWDQLMKIIDDRESMHDTWEEWLQTYNNAKKSLKAQGFKVYDITIDLNDLKKYCKDRGLKNNGKTRSMYVTDLPVPD